MEEQRTCREQVQEHKNSRLNDLKILLYGDDEAKEREELPDLWDYGLGFDYVPSNTFGNQPQGYFRFQISWGGPAEEIRFYTDATTTLYKAEFWFLDWWDGAKKILSNEDWEIAKDLFLQFKDVGLVEEQLKPYRE